MKCFNERCEYYDVEHESQCRIWVDLDWCKHYAPDPTLPKGKDIDMTTPDVPEQILSNESDRGHSEFLAALTIVISSVKGKLIEKNRKYGNSALKPIRLFSKAPADEQIRVRLDDKLSRIMSGQCDDDEDVTQDLLGYLLLLEIWKEMEG